MITPASEADRQRVRELLGREPMGAFSVAVRALTGDPIVIENAPLLADGTPMPTRYWLVGPAENHAVSVLEADGGVRWAEAVIPEDHITAAHQRHAEQRDISIPESHTGPRPSGGVGGTRTGVKCLHAHYACFLAGEPDPVGRWVADRLAEVRIDLGPTSSRITISGLGDTLPVGLSHIDALLEAHDPPHPADLTNAIGLATDHLDDLALRTGVERNHVPRLVVDGVMGPALASLEMGTATNEPIDIDRDTLEELFRLLAVDDVEGRRSNPGPNPENLDHLLAASIICVALTRRLNINLVRLGDPIARSVRA